MSIEKLSNILGADLIKKIYEDGASPAVQQVGKIGEDTLKALRLLTAPIQLLASYQDRLTNYLNKLYQSVPEDKQIPAPPQIAGPIIEKFKYLDENNYLTEVYLSLLQKAINKEEVAKAHPAFFSIIEHLSSDEVLILHHLKAGMVLYQANFDVVNIGTNNKLKQLDVKLVSNLGVVNILNSSYTDMHLNNIKRLGLIENKMSQTTTYSDPETKKHQIGLLREDEINLSTFGAMFVDACIGNEKILNLI